MSRQFFNGVFVTTLVAALVYAVFGGFILCLVFGLMGGFLVGVGVTATFLKYCMDYIDKQRAEVEKYFEKGNQRYKEAMELYSKIQREGNQRYKEAMELYSKIQRGNQHEEEGSLPVLD
jgi:hypothetical protein